MGDLYPVFFKVSGVRFTVHEVCVAAEASCGKGSVHGAQQIGALWRLYLKSKVAKLDIITKGIILRGVKTDLVPRNPFLTRGTEGQDVPVTKLYVGNVPISYSDEEITKGLEKIGVKMLSKLDMERVRGPDGKLTNWVTGRRMVWIEIPKSPLPRLVDCGLFKAVIFHKEMIKEMECRKCFGRGHKAKECVQEERCRRCKEVGHRAADCSVRTDRGRDGVPREEAETVGSGVSQNEKDCRLEDRCLRCGSVGHKMVECSKLKDKVSTDPEVDVGSAISESEGSEEETGENVQRRDGERKQTKSEDSEELESEGEAMVVVRRRKRGAKSTRVNKKEEKEKYVNEKERKEFVEMNDVTQVVRRVKSPNDKYAGAEVLEKEYKSANKGENLVGGKHEKKERGRDKVINTNTLDRYVARSESRKRTKTPDQESRSQRVKLTEGRES